MCMLRAATVATAATITTKNNNMARKTTEYSLPVLASVYRVEAYLYDYLWITLNVTKAINDSKLRPVVCSLVAPPGDLR